MNFSSGKSVSIIGGGLAGLTLGLGLRQLGVPVKVIEAGKFPRHRVCGEFISGRGLETLERLGLRRLLLNAGAVEANSAAFFNDRASSGVKKLPAPALCLSRFVLDDLFAREFRRRGGELREGERWRKNDLGEGTVRATGRRAQATAKGWRWFGLKAHARGIELDADLEMHVSCDGYVGLCRLADGVTNVCGLFRRRPDSTSTAINTRESLRGRVGSALHRRMSHAVLDENSICSIAGLSLQPQRATASRDCCIGDALTMIPPVTGNGMSMALESAEMALGPLAAWSRGEQAWPETQRAIARDCDAVFKRRLAWATWLQALVLSPVGQRPLVWLTARSELVWRLWFARTR